MTRALELLAQAADELGYTGDARALRKGGVAFIQVNAAVLAIEAALAAASLRARAQDPLRAHGGGE